MGALKLLTPEEVAEKLQVPLSWVRSASWRGEIPCVKVGKYNRYDPAAIEKWIAERTA